MSSVTKPDYAGCLIRGVEHFNATEFWEAHEAWEELWLVAATEVEQFLQGLIQVAAAYHHMKRGTFRGGVRLFDAGLRRLSAFPLRFSGIDRTDVEAAARVHRESAAVAKFLSEGEYPKLRLLTNDESPMPPSAVW